MIIFNINLESTDFIFFCRKYEHFAVRMTESSWGVELWDCFDKVIQEVR